MRLKHFLGSFFIMAILIFTFASYSYAAGFAPGYCTIDEVGTMSTQNMIFATCPTAGYTNQFFRVADPSVRKELLAVLLTAASTGNEVRLWIEDDGSTVTRVRMKGN